MKMKNAKPVKQNSKPQKKKGGGCFSLFCCCSRPQQADDYEPDQKYKEPESKLNLHSPPQSKQPKAEQAVKKPQQDTDDLIDLSYSSAASRRVEEEEFTFPLPDLRQVPLMQVYQHHIVRIGTNELIA